MALFFVQASYAQNEVGKDIKKLEKFLSNIDEHYVDSVETSTLVEEGMKRMLEQLDPHSVYLNAKDYQRATEPLKGSYKGLGVRFLVISDTMTITEVMEGGPAQSAGIMPGDKVIVINRDTVAGKGFTSSHISSYIKDSDEVNVSLGFLKPNERKGISSLQIKKMEIEVSSVPAYFMIDNRTGYIKLDKFSSSSLQDFRKGLDELKKARLKHLIVDLRGNGGGYLNVAVKIIDEFLEDRRLIVYTEGLHQEKRETFATSGGAYTEGDLYVLIDEGSASASEIFAGAIQDWDRGMIIGRRSFGKGLVQRTIEFDDGSAMRLTVSRYYTPSGRSIQRPYGNGNSDYQKEMANRLEHGEFFYADSIEVADSLLYFTSGNRKVFGGGGILPDVFVAADSNAWDDGLRLLRAKGMIDGFALHLAFNQGAEIRDRHRDAKHFAENFVITQNYFISFRQFAESRQVSLTDEAWSRAEPLIEALLMPAIARYVYGADAFYLVAAKFDTDILAALHEIDKGTYKALGLK